jgi:hypothetical protein
LKLYAKAGGMMTSMGPDQMGCAGEWWAMGYDGFGTLERTWGIDKIYNPTNGTTSSGDIMKLFGQTDSYVTGVINNVY